MISPNILKILKSTHEDPSYSVIITGYDQQESCDRDKTTLIVEQVNPNLYDIIENKEQVIDVLKKTLRDNNIEIPNNLGELSINNIVQRSFSIESGLDFDVNTSMFTSKLTGNLSNEVNIEPRKFSLCAQINSLYSFKITNPDNPVLFNRSKFKIRNNNLIIDIPNKVATVNVEIDQYPQGLATLPDPCSFESNPNIVSRRTFDETNIQNKQLIIPLTGNKHNIRLSYTLKPNLTNQYIESITTPLNRSIYVQFNYAYKTLPAVILTIDKDKQTYSSYDLSFNIDEDGNYTGVTIAFKNFRSSKISRDINIVIIGDEIDTTNDSGA